MQGRQSSTGPCAINGDTENKRGGRLRALLLWVCSALCAPAPLAAQPADSPPAGAIDNLDEWTLAYRRYNSSQGSSGGLHLVDAGSGAVGSLRLQAALESVPQDDFLETDGEVGRMDTALSASWTALELLEIYARFEVSGTTGETADATDPVSLHTHTGHVGFKMFHPVTEYLQLGGSLRAVLRSEAGGQSASLESTSVGVDALATLDFRELVPVLPLLVRGNVGYLFDNSARAIEEIEDARYESLDDPLARQDENRHLITRVERFALGINRVDRLTLALGVEAPLRVAERTYVHPMLEGSYALPVNRQGYDCVRVVDRINAIDEDDHCVARAKFRGKPLILSGGLRAVPPVRGLSVLFAVDVALNDTSRFVREFTPTPPFVVRVGLGYDYDARPAPPPAPAAPSVAARPRGDAGSATAARQVTVKLPREPSGSAVPLAVGGKTETPVAGKAEPAVAGKAEPAVGEVEAAAGAGAAIAGAAAEQPAE